MATTIRDLLQGASNAAASNVSAPIDGLAWLMRKAGLPVPQNALGGSQWMAEQGLTKQPTNALAGLAGETLGMVGPLGLAAKAPQVANALNQMGANYAASKTTGRMPMAGQRGAVVWHGSPHKFDAFDSSKIGTGEGAQAYGHGLYLSDSPTVAQGYADKLGVSPDTRIGKQSAGVALRRIAKNMFGEETFRTNTIVDYAKRALDKRNGNVDEAIAYISSPEWPGYDKDKVSKLLLALNGKHITYEPGKSLYKVDLPDEHIAKMLDWDKPLSQQAPGVRAAVSPMLDRMRAEALRPAPGWGDLQGTSPDVDALLKQLLKGGPETAAELRSRGVPGIRYLDGGSRAAGQGSSNYVIFPQNENLLSILERNGQPIKRTGP